MDDILQFLLIAGIIVIGIVKQFKKEAKKNADNSPAMPMPDTDFDDDALPIPESWGKTYGGYIPEGPRPEPKPVSTAKEEYQFSSSKHILEEILQIHPPNLLRLRRNRRFLLLHPYSKSPKLIPNMRSIRQKKHEKLLSGRKYCNESINKRKVES